MLMYIDYNFGQIVFAFSFLIAEIPCQLIAKRIGPDRWIPIQVTLWSIVAASQSSLSGRKSYLAVRSIMGMLEVGVTFDWCMQKLMIPGRIQL